MKEKRENSVNSGITNQKNKIKIDIRPVQGMSKVRTIHEVWKEFDEIKRKKRSGWHRFPYGIGKYHYLFYSKRGAISLIKLKDWILTNNKEYWEISCLEGNLFQDEERFITKSEAVERIRGLLL